MHNTHILLQKMDNVSSFQRPVLCHEGGTILQDKLMFVFGPPGRCYHRGSHLDDLVEVLHCQIEDERFIYVDLPLLTIGEGTQCKDVAPVHILEDLGIDYIGQCNFCCHLHSS